MINYKEYPPNWLSEIRPRIMQRANNCCERCGGEHGAINSRGSKIVLTIAHLDHDHENWDVTDDRLQALCQACHLALDFPMHMANRRYGRKHNGKHQLKLSF